MGAARGGTGQEVRWPCHRPRGSPEKAHTGSASRPPCPADKGLGRRQTGPFSASPGLDWRCHGCGPTQEDSHRTRSHSADYDAGVCAQPRGSSATRSGLAVPACCFLSLPADWVPWTLWRTESHAKNSGRWGCPVLVSEHRAPLRLPHLTDVLGTCPWLGTPRSGQGRTRQGAQPKLGDRASEPQMIRTGSGQGELAGKGPTGCFYSREGQSTHGPGTSGRDSEGAVVKPQRHWGRRQAVGTAGAKALGQEGAT